MVKSCGPGFSRDHAASLRTQSHCSQVSGDWCNTKRIHGAIGHISPVKHEVNHYVQTEHKLSPEQRTEAARHLA
jgi:hypothetical protein